MYLLQQYLSLVRSHEGKEKRKLKQINRRKKIGKRKMLTENTKTLKGNKTKVAEGKSENQGNANGELIQKC